MGKDANNQSRLDMGVENQLKTLAEGSLSEPTRFKTLIFNSSSSKPLAVTHPRFFTEHEELAGSLAQKANLADEHLLAQNLTAAI